VNAATASNTANTIVKRDETGGFAAEAITSTSVNTETLTATSVVTNTLKVTGGNYTSTGAVLTTDGTGNAVWSNSGLYTLNGISAAAQTFSTTTTASSTVPSFTSSGTVHTLNIPMASEDGTIAGLISKEDYSKFNDQKVSDVRGGEGIVVIGLSSGSIGSTYSVEVVAKSATTGEKGILQLTNDLGGTALLPVVNTVGGVLSSTITTIAASVLSATANNTASTLVQRDGSGGFAAGVITANSVVSSGNISSTSLNTGTLKVTGGSPTVGYVLTASNIDGTASWQVSSGGVTSVGTITTTSNTAGATVSGTTLVLSAADGTNGGVLTSGTQTIGGQKSFTNAVTNSTAFNAGSETTIDFSQSNLAYTTASPGAFTLSGMKDGGTYTLAVKGLTSGTSIFTASGLTPVNVGSYPTISGKQTVYTFVVMGDTFYYSMISEL
jgi:hypothetical protein